MTAQEVAAAIADGVGGTVREVPIDERNELVVALADGRVPVLVRGFIHGVGVCVIGSKVFHPPAEDAVPEMIAVINTWATSRPIDTVTLFELATTVASTLQDAFPDRFTIAFPGTPTPREAWVHGPDTTSVGVFERRVVTSVDGSAREIAVPTRAELGAVADVVHAVRAQREHYARNVDATKQLVRAAHTLAGQLSKKFGSQVTFLVAPDPRHDLVSEATIGCGTQRIKVRWKWNHGPWVHAGLVGTDGYDGPLDEGAFDGIVLAIERARTMLTIDKLVAGKRYRVRETLQALKRGTIVTFQRFDDIDNHYGRYVFTTGGEELAVVGDYSTPENSPLAEAHRYLEPLD